MSESASLPRSLPDRVNEGIILNSHVGLHGVLEAVPSGESEPDSFPCSVRAKSCVAAIAASNCAGQGELSGVRAPDPVVVSTWLAVLSGVCGRSTCSFLLGGATAVITSCRGASKLRAQREDASLTQTHCNSGDTSLRESAASSLCASSSTGGSGGLTVGIPAGGGGASPRPATGVALGCPIGKKATESEDSEVLIGCPHCIGIPHPPGAAVIPIAPVQAS
mmetsp:Transcript_30046/g.77328  ORF Transcript_30046/g.77328 Transcript_30046/m.77328 type:complete len:221 (+) Transcript_30046:1729-2391(+)